MSNKTKGIICLILALFSAFTYGAYAYGTLHGHPVEPHRWVLTGLCCLFWCGLAINNLSNKN